MGDNQMLCADLLTGEARRFLTGPVACEVTGLAFSDDCRAMFVGIQHPGEKGANSHFPGGGDSIPRSSVVVPPRWRDNRHLAAQRTRADRNPSTRTGME